MREEHFAEIQGRRGADPYENLANAIILQAVDDYRIALRGKVPWEYPCVSDAKQVKMKCEEFFRSRWFGVLTSVDGEWLINFLRNEYYSGKRIR